jgi:hypothetical protein
LRHAYRTAIASLSSVRLPEIKLPERHQLDRALSLVTRQVVRVPFYKRWVAVTVLVLATWVAFRDHHPAAIARPSAVATAKASSQLSPSSSTGPAAVSSKDSVIPALPAVPGAVVVAKPHWVRVGADELDYVGEDVTVRYFGVKPATQRAPTQRRVKKIGSDVTVHYFNPIAASSEGEFPTPQVHYISEGSTAPKRTPTPTTPQAVEQ